jgi:hypothetical protein
MTLGPHSDSVMRIVRTMCHGKSGPDPLSLSTSHPGQVKPLGPERRNTKSGRKLNSKPSFRYQGREPMLTCRNRFSENVNRNFRFGPPSRASYASPALQTTNLAPAGGMVLTGRSGISLAADKFCSHLLSECGFLRTAIDKRFGRAISATEEQSAAVYRFF